MRFEKIKEPRIMGSYSQKDVTFVLKDISNMIEEKSNEERRIYNAKWRTLFRNVTY